MGIEATTQAGSNTHRPSLADWLTQLLDGKYCLQPSGDCIVVTDRRVRPPPGPVRGRRCPKTDVVGSPTTVATEAGCCQDEIRVRNA